MIDCPFCDCKLQASIMSEFAISDNLQEYYCSKCTKHGTKLSPWQGFVHLNSLGPWQWQGLDTNFTKSKVVILMRDNNLESYDLHINDKISIYANKSLNSCHVTNGNHTLYKTDKFLDPKKLLTYIKCQAFK